MDSDAYREAEERLWRHYGMEPSERWLNLRDPFMRLRVQEVGEGPPVLFLHGGPSAGSAWAPLVSRLPGLRCILLDRPGCGLSSSIDYGDGPIDRTMARVLEAAVDELGLARVDIVASSLGGACAFWLAQRRPSLVRRIVQHGCPAFVSRMSPNVPIRLLATPAVGALFARLPVNRRSVDEMMKSMGHEDTMAAHGVPEAYLEWICSLLRESDTMLNDRRFLRRGLTWRGTRPGLVITDEALQSLEQPTYFYWGSEDPFGSAEFGRTLAGGMKHGEIDVSRGSGHLPWLDDPDEAAGRTAEFLAA
jgi:pimeloyl-ACP methyl ester carboxylesterase